MKETRNLSTSRLWEHFEGICRIPRPSKSEEQIRRHILAFARDNGLEAEKDDAGNVLIRKPASKGFEDRKPVILQGHLDMVGEKEPSSTHDFTRDPITPVVDGDWIRASGTTLGADCGIGIAAQMVILEDPQLEHGPVECLFTVDEESGMTGARGLRMDFLEGQILLNLDSEDEGELFIGCAGGIDTLGNFRFELQKPLNTSQAYRVSVEGLRGGHSGDEIHISPGNAIKVINEFLLESTKKYELQLEVLDGGNMRNAIPRDAFAVFALPRQMAGSLEKHFRHYVDRVTGQLAEYESGMRMLLEPAGMPEKVLTKQQQLKFLQTISDCPHGVIRWSSSLEGMVETSTNLASVKFLNGSQAIVTTSQRSSVESAKAELARSIAQCFENGDGQVEHSDGYPGWTPNADSEILNITRQAYRDLFGQDPVVRAIHAGLECGLILEKYPELDMLSFGPTIKGAHTPTERIHIQSTEKFWKLLLEVLRRIPPA